MSDNPFDLECCGDHELDGLFSSLKKAAKKKASIFKGIAKKKKDIVKKAHKHKLRAAKHKLESHKRVLNTVKSVQDSKIRVIRGKQSAQSSINRSWRGIKKDKLFIDKGIHRAAFGKYGGAKVDKFKDSKGFKAVRNAVGVAVGTYFGAPLVGAALGSSAVAGAGGSSLTAAVGKSLASTAIEEGARKFATTKLEAQKKNHERQIFKNIRADILGALQVDQKYISQLQNDPDFKRALDKMIREGKSLEEIKSAWASSNAYQHLVREQVPKTFERPIYNAMVAEGVPQARARVEAPIIANELVDQAADNVQSKVDKNTVFAVLVPIAATLLLGA